MILHPAVRRTTDGEPRRTARTEPGRAEGAGLLFVGHRTPASRRPWACCKDALGQRAEILCDDRNIVRHWRGERRLGCTGRGATATCPRSRRRARRCGPSSSSSSRLRTSRSAADRKEVWQRLLGRSSGRWSPAPGGEVDGCARGSSRRSPATGCASTTAARSSRSSRSWRGERLRPPRHRPRPCCRAWARSTSSSPSAATTTASTAASTCPRATPRRARAS